MNRKCRKTIYLSAIACFFLVSLPVMGADYYVDQAGDDANPGTVDQPWRTLAKAAEIAAAGDTVYIKSGTYSERLVPRNSGSEGNWITFMAYPGHTVTIDGEGVAIPYDPPWGGIVEVQGRSYIRISGLGVVNSTSAGIFVWDSSSHILIEKNATYNTFSSGIGVWGCNNITIDGNEVELACNDGSQECITVSGIDTFEVKRNEVHNGGPGTNGGEGIDAKEACMNGKIFGNRVHDLSRVGIYVDAWDSHATNIEVFGNESYANPSGFALSTENGGLLEDVRVYGNVAHDNEGIGFWVAGWGVEGAGHHLRAIEVYGNTSRDNGDGFAIYGQQGSLFESVRLQNNLAYRNRLRALWVSGPDELTTEPLMNDVWVINNTFHGNGLGDWGGGITLDNLAAENVVVRNNILSENLSFQIVTGSNLDISGLAVDFNLIDGFRGSSGEILGESYVEGDPLFVDSGGGDFHIIATSPAVDAATPEGAPDFDFDGNPRPQGSGHDIGAFEYGLPPPDEAEEALPEGTEPLPEQADGYLDATYDAPADAPAEGDVGQERIKGGCGCTILR